ncbi:zinc-dependent alcohol dehydrogenase family protein [Aureimonas populi]|uniref:Zinc-dependent alcohol dehydrogenase family protein n=1 Tax=Aureimonas populi TaxID=1701758 RepID=A0ABW5CI93_9HYPH|nr:zinc-dependent alcohol dehydrogenase family protein [Aureimonas populi]
MLVRMRASAINPSDLIPVTGAYRHRTALPFVPGYDGVGVVADVGPGVDPAMLGRRVLPLGSAGNWSTWKALPAEWCIDVPDDIADEQAAMAYINPLTARLMVQALSPKPGARIGMTAGASSIGRMLIRLLHAAGALPLAIVRSERSRHALRGEPVEIIEESRPLPSLDAGLDAVGGLAGARLAAAIEPAGVLLHYGLLSGRPLTGALLEKAKASVRMFRLRDWVHASPRSDFRAAMAEAFGDIRTGLSASPVAAAYPLSAFQDALLHNARPDRRGKILLRL